MYFFPKNSFLDKQIASSPRVKEIKRPQQWPPLLRDVPAPPPWPPLLRDAPVAAAPPLTGPPPLPSPAGPAAVAPDPATSGRRRGLHCSGTRPPGRPARRGSSSDLLSIPLLWPTPPPVALAVASSRSSSAAEEGRVERRRQGRWRLGLLATCAEVRHGYAAGEYCQRRRPSCSYCLRHGHAAR
jgi:hypothetical protein